MSVNHPTNGEKNGPAKKIILLFLAIPVFLVIAEIILTIIPIDSSFQNRFFLVNRALDYPDVFKKDIDLFWRFRPSQTISSRFFQGKEYRINSLGLRDDEIPEKSDKIRIVAIGNSCTFGWSIPLQQVYIKQLESLINADHELPEVETINAGIPGYSSFQGRRFFYSDIARLKPDILLMMFGWNDQWAAADNIPDRDQEMPPEYIINIQNLFSNLKTYRILKKIILSVIEQPLKDKLIKENPVYRVSDPEFYDNLDVIIQYCKNDKIIPILLTSPIPSLEKYYPRGKRSPMHEYHEYYNYQTRLLARNNKSPLVNAALIFDDYNDLFDDAANDPIHFNDRGHKIIAQSIYEYLKENKHLLSK